MEVFVAAVAYGSFTAAASAFSITPAMVSKPVSALEKRWGTACSGPPDGSISPIPARVITRTTVRSWIRCPGRRRGVAQNATPRGLLRISASIWFGSLTLAPILCRYLRRHPKVNAQLSLTDRYIDIVEESYDVAIRIGHLEDSTSVARRLGQFDVATCASPDYLSRRGVPDTPHDLLRHECLGFTLWRSESGWLLMQRQRPVKATRLPCFESDNAQAPRAAALEGIGIIMMPRALLEPDSESGRLVKVLAGHLPPTRPFHAVYPRGRQGTPKLKTFVEFLLAEFRPQEHSTSRRVRAAA